MSEIPEVAQFIRELRELRDRIAAREDTVMLALAELAKQVRELADRVSRLEHDPGAVQISVAQKES